MSQARIADYRSALRSSVRGGWQGVFDQAQTMSALDAAVKRHLLLAFYAGAMECDLAPDEMTPEETSWINTRITTEMIRVPAFATAIVKGRKDGPNPVKLDSLFSRAEMWVLQWQRVFEQGQQFACGNYKAKWVYGDTINHCPDCSRAEGRVYRIETWNKYGWIPGSRALACGGWRCDCKREQTSEPVTRGRPPSIRGK